MKKLKYSIWICVLTVHHRTAVLKGKHVPALLWLCQYLCYKSVLTININLEAWPLTFALCFSSGMDTLSPAVALTAADQSRSSLDFFNVTLVPPVTADTDGEISMLTTCVCLHHQPHEHGCRGASLLRKYKINQPFKMLHLAVAVTASESWMEIASQRFQPGVTGHACVDINRIYGTLAVESFTLIQAV